MNFEEITLKINGTVRSAPMPADIRLVDALRCLGYTGTKEGCGEGECGACTVLLDGRPVNSCLLFAKQVQGKEIVTVEGVGRGHPDGMHPFQKALVAVGGVQCGFCTPGVVVTGAHLCDTRPKASVQEIKEALAGNLCRCTGYAKIIEAVEVAVAELGKQP